MSIELHQVTARVFCSGDLCTRRIWVHADIGEGYEALNDALPALVEHAENQYWGFVDGQPFCPMCKPDEES